MAQYWSRKPASGNPQRRESDLTRSPGTPRDAFLGRTHFSGHSICPALREIAEAIMFMESAHIACIGYGEIDLERVRENYCSLSVLERYPAPSLPLVDRRQINQVSLMTIRTRSVALSELPADVAGYQIYGEQVGNGTEPSIFVEPTQLRV